MNLIFLALFIFLDLIFYIVIIDVIFSWLALAGIRFRPKFLRDILDPIYSFIRSYVPSKFGAFDFTPIIVIFSISILKSIIISSSPQISQLLNQVTTL